MSDRFYFSGDWDGPILLEESECHHLARVLRKSVGDRVELFDGRGQSASAVVVQVGKRSVTLELDSSPQSEAAALPQVTLAVAPPKGDRFRWLVEKATELGVHRLVPLQCERSVVSPGENKLDKLRQTMLAACKQCGRNSFMQIDPPCAFSREFLTPTLGTVLFGACLEKPTNLKDRLSGPLHEKCTIVIGPEGGLSEAEQHVLLSAGGIPVCVSPYTLRVETAAIMIATLCLLQSD